MQPGGGRIPPVDRSVPRYKKDKSCTYGIIIGSFRKGLSCKIVVPLGFGAVVGHIVDTP